MNLGDRSLDCGVAICWTYLSPAHIFPPGFLIHDQAATTLFSSRATVKHVSALLLYLTTCRHEFLQREGSDIVCE